MCDRYRVCTRRTKLAVDIQDNVVSYMSVCLSYYATYNMQHVGEQKSSMHLPRYVLLTLAQNTYVVPRERFRSLSIIFISNITCSYESKIRVHSCFLYATYIHTPILKNQVGICHAMYAHTCTPKTIEEVSGWQQRKFCSVP